MIGRPIQVKVYEYFWFQPVFSHSSESSSNASLPYRSSVRAPSSSESVAAAVSMVIRTEPSPARRDTALDPGLGARGGAPSGLALQARGVGDHARRVVRRRG